VVSKTNAVQPFSDSGNSHILHGGVAVTGVAAVHMRIPQHTVRSPFRCFYPVFPTDAAGKNRTVTIILVIQEKFNKKHLNFGK